MLITSEVKTFQLIYEDESLSLEVIDEDENVDIGYDFDAHKEMENDYYLNILDGRSINLEFYSNTTRQIGLQFTKENYFSEVKKIIAFFERLSLSLEIRKIRDNHWFEEKILEKIPDRIVPKNSGGFYVIEEREIFFHFEFDSLRVFFQGETFHYKYKDLIFDTGMLPNKISLLVSN